MSNVWRRVCRSIRSSKFQVVSIIIICFVILLYTTNDSPTETSEDLRIKINKRQQQNQQLFTRSKTTKNNITSNAKSINPYPFRVVIAPKPCTNEDVVFIVHSAVQYFDRRMLMRYTWLNRNNLQETLALKVKIVFVTGMTNNTNVLTKLSYEQEFYQDILQSDFTDAYLNNTYKAISFLRWVSSKQGCPNASLIVKVDDDALMHSVQLPRFNETVHQILNKHRENVYMGKLISTHVNRDNSSKWFVSYELWPDKRYPIWFQGLAYMMTPKLAAKLPSLALNTAYMFTDDVYVGVLVSKIKDVDLIIDNSIGAHTLQNLSSFFQSFLKDGAVFYHVPSIEYFFKWYYVDGHRIKTKLHPTVVKKKLSPKIHKNSDSPSASAVTVIVFISVVLVVVVGLLLIICCISYLDAQQILEPVPS